MLTQLIIIIRKGEFMGHQKIMVMFVILLNRRKESVSDLLYFEQMG